MFGRLPLRLVAVLVAVVALLVPAAGAGAQDGTLRQTTSVDYVVLPEAGRVDVRFSYSFVNEGSGVAYPGFFESLPVTADEVAASSGSEALVVAQTGFEDGTATWFVQFARSLGPGASTEIELTWSIMHDGLPGPLVVPGAVSFDAFRPGPATDAAASPLRVTIPASYAAADGSTPVSGIDEPLATFEFPAEAYDGQRLQFVDHAAFDGDLIDLPPLAAVTSWSGDREWIADTADRAAAIASELDTWFGTLDEGFAIRRALPSAGHDLVEDDLVELADDDAASVDHQLAHIWLADVDVDVAWFIEGLAIGFAGEPHLDASPEAMVADLVDELGAAGVRAVIDALRAETTPYPGPVAEPRILDPGWQTLLDLIERAGGVDDAASAFREMVTDDVDDLLIDRRAAAVVDYAALESRAGSWALPPFLRHAMAAWEFDTFFGRQAEVSDVIVTRDSLAGWAASLELEPRTDAQVLFEEAADDLTAVVDLLERQEMALDAFDEAEAAVTGDRGLLATVGLWGSDPDADLLALRELWAAGDDAELAHDAHELTDSIEGAVGRGTIRLLVPALVIIALWQGLRWVRRRATAGGARSPEADQPVKSSA
ncbi:MAG: hypothetical protein R8F63_17215 [Acidimicrobiales bacterium]|nr:hypothetical protein [Acidimicrobiales bacterium]